MWVCTARTAPRFGGDQHPRCTLQHQPGTEHDAKPRKERLGEAPYLPENVSSSLKSYKKPRVQISLDLRACFPEVKLQQGCSIMLRVKRLGG